VPRALTVEGEGGARLWGRWSVSRFSQGTIRGVMCAYETEGVAWPCVLVRGDPWLFDECQIRSAGAYAVMCAKQASVTVRRCGVGGMGSGSRRAINAVIIMDSSWCLLQVSVRVRELISPLTRSPVTRATTHRWRVCKQRLWPP